MPTPDQRLIDELFRSLKGEDENGHNRVEHGGVAGISKLTDSAVLEKLFSESTNGGKWREVYNGEFREYYPSPSEAVAAILYKLAFYSGNDPVQMERLLRGSGLPSEKFDSPRGGSSWLRREMEKAIEATPQSYAHERHTPEGRPSSSFEGSKDKETPTHDELRDRWLSEHPGYGFGLGRWRRYEGGFYSPLDESEVKRSVVKVLEENKDRWIRPSVPLLNSVLELVRLEVYVKDDRWDADPGIMVAKNGAIDLTSGKLLAHSPRHYCTTRLPYEYDPDAGAPRWEYFLDSTLDREVANFLQEYAGYCLTTDTSQEKAIWLIGPPGGGKSTLLVGLVAMLGVRAGVLGLAEIEKSRFALAKLEGKTLVTAAEQPAGFVSCHHILNSIISGEPLQVERKYKDAYDLIPRAKIAWAMNEAPRIPSGAEGLFRRIEVISFPEIAPGDRDPTLKEGIKNEGSGILNWALEGLMRLRERGRFEVPTSIRKATAQFRESNDIPALFVEERCTTGEDLKIKASDLYETYKGWCFSNGHKAKSSTSVAEDWRRLGFTKTASKGCNYWKGVALRGDYLELCLE